MNLEYSEQELESMVPGVYYFPGLIKNSDGTIGEGIFPMTGAFLKRLIEGHPPTPPTPMIAAGPEPDYQTPEPTPEIPEPTPVYVGQKYLIANWFHPGAERTSIQSKPAGIIASWTGHGDMQPGNEGNWFTVPEGTQLEVRYVAHAHTYDQEGQSILLS